MSWSHTNLYADEPKRSTVPFYAPTWPLMPQRCQMAAVKATAKVVSETSAATTTPERPTEETRQKKKKTVLVVGIDDSEHSYHALEWTLRRFFCPAPGASESPCELVVVYAKPHPNSIVSPAVPGAAEVIRWVDADLRKVAAAVVEKIRAICVENKVNALAKVVEGDAREILCAAVKEHQADVLVLGSHGYGAIKRTLLGSVSEYCARHAHCTVMIVKNPKSKR